MKSFIHFVFLVKENFDFERAFGISEVALSKPRGQFVSSKQSLKNDTQTPNIGKRLLNPYELKIREVLWHLSKKDEHFII